MEQLPPNKEIILGPHSIFEAIKNPNRQGQELYGTKEGLNEFKKLYSKEGISLEDKDVKILSTHDLNQKLKQLGDERGFKVTRAISNIFLLVDPLEEKRPDWLYQKIKNKNEIKILVLDQVTDVYNGAAIMRTAAFYGIDCLLYSMKGVFGHSPAFTRIASGGIEHVPIVKCSSLPKLLKKLNELGVKTIGLSEHEEIEMAEDEDSKKLCLVLGAEDKGLSHAVLRVIENKVALRPLGGIKSLNVSVAAAVAMEKIFGK